MQAMQSLKGRVVAGKHEAHAAEARTWETLEKIFEPRGFVEGLIRTFGGKRASVAGLVRAYLVSVQSVISAAVSEEEGTFFTAICHVSDGFPVKRSFDAPDPYLGVVLSGLGIARCITLFFCSSLVKILDFCTSFFH